jgi:ERCC4-type nuclease
VWRIQPEDVTIIIDSREQAPFDLSPMRAERGTLATGDYTVRGLEELVAVERKELGDLIGCLCSGRERFTRELQRMKAYPARVVVVEASWADLASGNYRSQMEPEAATNTIASWTGRFCVPFMFCGDRRNAQIFAARFLFHEARRWAERAEALRAPQVAEAS